MTASLLGLKIIEDKLRSELQTMIERKASSAFLASVLPPPDRDGALLRIEASLRLRIESLSVDYTAHAGGDTRKNLEWDPEEKMIEIKTSVRAERPADMKQSETLNLHLSSLSLDAAIAGIEFKKTMIGIGATVHGASLRITLSGTGTGTWITCEKEGGAA